MELLEYHTHSIHRELAALHEIEKNSRKIKEKATNDMIENAHEPLKISKHLHQMMWVLEATRELIAATPTGTATDLKSWRIQNRFADNIGKK